MSSRIARALASVIAVAAAALPAWSAPANLPVGGSVSPVPTYSSSTTPTVHVLANTGLQTATLDDMTVQFQELAVSTSLNPSGVSFAFALATSNNPTSLSVALPGFGLSVGGQTLTTLVESCDPFDVGAGATVCGAATGMATRSGTPGDVITFSSLGTTPVAPPGGATTYVSNVYGVFTNAPSWVDPHVTLIDDGTTFTFNGIAPASGTPVPEPGTLALLGFGLAGVWAARRRRS
jgi:PEP-CTERM motif